MTIPEVNLVVNIIILILVLASMALRLMRNFPAHVITMAVAFFMWVGNLIYLFVVFPSTQMGVDHATAMMSNPLSFFMFILHENLAVVTAIFAVWLIALWFLSSNSTDFESKSTVQAIAVSAGWVSAFVIGVWLFVTFNL